MKGLMRRKKGKYRRVAVALTTAMMLTACGNTDDTVVTDYGAVEVEETATSSDGETNEADSYYEADRDDSMENIELSIDEEFSHNDSEFSISCSYTKELDLNSLYTYHANRIADSESEEEKIVASLFDGTGKKVTSISNSVKKEYVPFLYKYRTLKTILEKEPRDVSNDYFETIVNYDSIITPGTNEECNWEDNDNYFIHIYEGMYNDTRFGLIYAYDKVEKARYIYFEPVNIDEYYPDSNIKTSMLRNSVDNNGNPCVGNVCTLEYTEVWDTVYEFLDKELDMSEAETELGIKYDTYSMRQRPFMGYTDLEYDDGNHKSISQVVFSDSDYVHTVVDYSPTFNRDGIEFQNTDQFPRSVELLAEQDDLMEEALGEGYVFMESMWSPYQYLNWEENDEEVNYIYDGYALYLNPGFVNSYDITDGFSAASAAYLDEAPINSGVVSVTSKGIYSVDIVQMLDVESVTTAHLLKTDELKEPLIEALKSDDFSNLIDSGSSVFVCMANLMNYYDENSSTYVPTWDFIVDVIPKDYDPSSATDAEMFEESDSSFSWMTYEPDGRIHIYINAETGDVLGIED